ncbi:MAG: hypothetical protein FWE04_01730 [Oscillospiraceae bacterium]|nr:hypothetical protein [Oscillospiraceae bacterium]
MSKSKWKKVIVCVIIALFFTFPLPFLFDTSANLIDILGAIVMWQAVIFVPIIAIGAIILLIKLITEN